MTMYYYKAMYLINDRFGTFAWTYVSEFYDSLELVNMLTEHVWKSADLVSVTVHAITADEYFKAVLA